MKNLGITQRVEFIESYAEKRDCLDQNWSHFAAALGFNPVPLANIEASKVAQYVQDLHLKAIILSGGNSLAAVDADAKDVALERDAFEMALIQHAIESNIPLIGVCRGMQLLNNYFGGQLSPINNHVATKHKIIQHTTDFSFPQVVNSYHNWSIAEHDCAKDVIPLATDEAGYCEALKHRKHKILAIMWHPERETPFLSEDLQLFKEFFT